MVFKLEKSQRRILQDGGYFERGRRLRSGSEKADTKLAGISVGYSGFGQRGTETTLQG